MAKKEDFSFKTTKDLPVAKAIIDQVIGQESAVELIKKAALQRRHVLLIGEPGTGKSMLGVALAELLPKEKLVDIISFPNANDENQPLIRTMPAGKGREFVLKAKLQNISVLKNQNIFLFLIIIASFFGPYFIWRNNVFALEETANAIIFAASTMSAIVLVGLAMMMMNFGKRMENKTQTPKVIVDNFDKKQVPFLDATGAHAGALLGDVLHDPFQSGGLGTPAHERVVAGMIHKAHMGVLFIDEIATLQPATQQDLLTSLQERKYPITGQSERSAGAMVRTEAVPCNFILVAAGNYDTLKHMHPALRSRIRGYGYEVYMDETIPDTPENRHKIAVFVAQEVTKDGKIPHFSKDAVDAIIEEARRRANRKGHLTLRLRDLGGLVRAAGDLAQERKSKFVERKHVDDAKEISRTLEQQIVDKIIERRKDYQLIQVEGTKVGKVNGLAVFAIGNEAASGSGIVSPIEATVTKGGNHTEINATGGLGDIAKESVTNVSALIKTWFNEDIQEHKDIYIQFVQTHGVEGDSASIAIAVAIISALKGIPIKQSIAMTGSLSVRGKVLPVGGVTSKVEAAIQTGIKTVIVPKSNLQDIIADKDKLKKIKIVPVTDIYEVLDIAFDWKGKTAILKKIKQINGN